jgi:hypothetical protein
MEWGRTRACKVALHYSPPCKPSHNWSPSACSCSTEWVMMCLVMYNSTSFDICAVIHFMLKHECCRNPLWIMCGLQPKGTVRQWCRMFRDGWGNKCSWWRVKWLAICSEWWSCSKCLPNNLWKMALHNFRTFMWISTNFMNCYVWDCHS